MRGLLRQMAGFLGVGGIGFLVDIGTFNILRATLFDPQHVAGGALLAKAVSTLVAVAVNWVGNRHLTFRRERGARLGPEALRFLAASLLGSSVSLACLAISHYVLGLSSAVADNLSANVIGLALGTVLRFVMYRTWVFRMAST